MSSSLNLDNIFNLAGNAPPQKKPKPGELPMIKGYPIIDVLFKRMIDIKAIIDNNIKNHADDIDQFIKSVEIEV